MRARELKFLWGADLHRYAGCKDLRTLLKYLMISEGYKYSFLMRLCRYLSRTRWQKLARPLYLLSMAILKHYQYKFGISIYPSVTIGSGLYIGHYGGIIV